MRFNPATVFLALATVSLWTSSQYLVLQLLITVCLLACLAVDIRAGRRARRLGRVPGRTLAP